MAQIAFLVDKDGNIVLDDNGHPIPKDVADATSFNRSNVQPQDVPGLFRKEVSDRYRCHLHTEE